MKPLVLNTDAGKQIQSVICNLLPHHRLDVLEGREHIVVPMVILTEGVHLGSNGPLYYPKEELSKTPVVWNHKPIVVYHPQMNGQGVSACSPVILNSRKVGVMLNTKYEKGKLKSEAWIDKGRVDGVDERIMAAINANEMMELSTGVFVDTDMGEGEWKGEAYTGIARNYRPDHLALLPDKIGACSINDGAGFLRNQTAEEMIRNAKRMIKEAEKLGAIKVVNRHGKADNEMSFGNIRETVATILRKKFNPSQDGSPSIWVEDVYTNFVIYEKDGKLFRLGYTSADTGVTLSDEAPVEVVRVTEYRTVEGAFVGNQDQTESKTDMEKQKLVAAIIVANAGWSKDDQEALMAMNEKQLEAIRKGIAPPESPPKPTENQGKQDPPKKEDPKPTENQGKPQPPEKKVVTLESYIGDAPREIQEVLQNGMSIYAEEKQRLVEAIMTNANNSFDKADLENRPLGELKRLARLAAVPQPTSRTANYGGQGNVPVDNTEVEEALVMPAMSFTK